MDQLVPVDLLRPVVHFRHCFHVDLMALVVQVDLDYRPVLVIHVDLFLRLCQIIQAFQSFLFHQVILVYQANLEDQLDPGAL